MLITAISWPYTYASFFSGITAAEIKQLGLTPRIAVVANFTNSLIAAVPPGCLYAVPGYLK